MPNEELQVRRQGGQIWSAVRQKWLIETPEERVRQEYLCMLVNEFGFKLDQIAEELEVTGRGSGQARADFVIWRTALDKSEQKNPLIVVECKSDNVTIRAEDYGQGENYARLSGARFFVTHNSRETKFWRVIHDRMPKHTEEIESIPHAEATDKEIEDLLAKLKTFREDEFADLLHQCHNVIRNREHLDPAAAFDEIAKILFVKVWVERQLKERRQRKNLFTVDVLKEQLADNPIDSLFDQTKRFYRIDRIFAQDDRINLRPATVEKIVEMLQKYDLSATSTDIKGIAFERFLGRTFRGEIGQFFTPRSIVEFMVRMLEPKEGDVICDPASGSGGFLIRFFEIVREQIAASVDAEYKAFAVEVEKKKWSKIKKAEALRKKYEQLQQQLDPVSDADRPAIHRERSRIWHLANRCIYGCDANDRMARTSKMNMIMHGDGHGGVHHHNGFLNVNGIFEGHFDIILTNPPFGANVESSDVILPEQVKVSDEARSRYKGEYGQPYVDALKRLQAAEGQSILSLFELPERGDKKAGKIKTELLFLERCLSLLKPGGRLGIVLPEGVFNTQTAAYVRKFCENRAYVRAVVSLPQDAFVSSGASVKASLLFMQKFTEKEQAEFNGKRKAASYEIAAKYAPEIETETRGLEAEVAKAYKDHSAKAVLNTQSELREYAKQMDQRKRAEARALLKQRFAYPVFLYEAEKVGITATGEPDENELYPNPKQPPGLEKSCLEVYHEFLREPEAFLLQRPGK
jgi:type I restriction enzyme M protein